jgi:hypothetical protein
LVPGLILLLLRRPGKVEEGDRSVLKTNNKITRLIS